MILVKLSPHPRLCAHRQKHCSRLDRQARRYEQNLWIKALPPPHCQGTCSVATAVMNCTPASACNRSGAVVAHQFRTPRQLRQSFVSGRNLTRRNKALSPCVTSKAQLDQVNELSCSEQRAGHGGSEQLLVVQPVDRCRRSLLAGVAALSILPLQASSVLALGNAKTVSWHNRACLLATEVTWQCVDATAAMAVAMKDSLLPNAPQVFVAGATGNTGNRVVQQLSAKGYKVLAGTRVSEQQSSTHITPFQSLARGCLQYLCR